MMLDLFEALADLYQGKCEYAGLVIHDQSGNYSRLFQKWTRKLYQAQIKKEDIRRGLKHLEEQNRDSSRTGNEIWPCDYATFIGHCQKQKEREERKDWKRLEKSKMSNEERKQKMKKLRGDMGL